MGNKEAENEQSPRIFMGQNLNRYITIAKHNSLKCINNRSLQAIKIKYAI